jgi:lipopolysaccharide export system permease protein
MLARYLRSFVATLLLLLVAVLIGDMLLDLSDLLENRAEVGWVTALTGLALRTPARYLPVLIPVASFAAAFLTLGLAARWREVTAMKAGGISPLSAAAPVLGAALALAGLAFVLNETVVLRANRVLEGMDRGDAEEIAMRRGTFWFHTGSSIYNVRDSDPETRTLNGVTILELDDRGRIARSVHADKARVVSGAQWVLEGAVVRTFDLAQRGAPPREERAAELAVAVAGKSDRVLLDARAASLSLDDLQDAIQARSAEGAASHRFQALLHERVSDPLSVFLFALLAVPLGLAVEDKKTLAVPALQGVVLLVLFFFARNVGSTLATQGVTPAAWTPWTILALFGVFGAVRLSNVPR